VTLTPSHELIPRELHKDYQPQYAIVGGLVFIIAGLPVLTQCFAYRNYTVGDAVGNLLQAARVPPSNRDADAPQEQDAQAVICSECLAHAVNEGFRDFVGSRLHSLNGVKVRHMAHLVALLEPFFDSNTKLPASHVILNFYESTKSVVLETSGLRAAMQTIQWQHKVPGWSSLAEAGPGGGATHSTITN